MKFAVSLLVVTLAVVLLITGVKATSKKKEHPPKQPDNNKNNCCNCCSQCSNSGPAAPQVVPLPWYNFGHPYFGGYPQIQGGKIPCGKGKKQSPPSSDDNPLPILYGGPWSSNPSPVYNGIGKPTDIQYS